MVAIATTYQHRLNDRLLAQDIAALAEIYDQFAATVFGTALLATNDRQEAEAVTQDVLLDLWQQPGRLDPQPGGLRSWLAAVVHNRSVDWIRRQQTDPGLGRPHVIPSLLGKMPGDATQAEATAERIRTAVSALPEAERTAIQMAYFSSRSYRQVADALAAPEWAITSRIRSGLRQLSLTVYAEAALN